MLRTKLTAAALSAAMLFSTVAPAMAATSLTISGNGADSQSAVQLDVQNKTTVVQNNDANISNKVTTNTDTGNNLASYNTGGDVSVNTGDAVAKVEVSNAANLNKAVVADCDCVGADKNLTISGNGADSDNDVNLTSKSQTELFQTNEAKFDNDVDVFAKTGGNQASKNTGKDGSGSVAILTGDALIDVSVSNLANKNVALVGKLGSQNGGTVNATITGNGSDSKNNVTFDFQRKNTAVQYNKAYFENNVDVNAKSGQNSANDNTGGQVFIGTGDAKAFVDVVNAANFNWAALADCGCLVNLNGKIGENGSQSKNTLDFHLDTKNDAFQENLGKLDNDVESDAKSGGNQAEKNTTGNGDPAILTGDSGSLTQVENRANANLFSTSGVTVDFDLSEVAAFLGF